MPLLLWDIDGTLLLKASREHAQAIHAAIKRVYHVDIPDGQVEAAGRTDIAIARSILTLASVSAARVAAAGRTDGAIARDILLHCGVAPAAIDELVREVADVCEREYQVCEHCGKVEAVDPAVLDPLRDALAAGSGFRARFTHFPVHGHCAACVKELGL